MLATKFSRVENSTLNEKVYEELRRAIMSARLQPGESVTLRGLAVALGTSVMPIRDAVRRLVAERALEMGTRSVRVPLLTRRRFDEVCAVRCIVEGEAAGLAAKRIEPADLEELKSLNEKIAASLKREDMTTAFKHNQVFHFTVYQAAGIDLILPIIENLWLLAGPYLVVPASRKAQLRASYREGGVVQHTKLLDALRARKSDVAAKAIRDDIRETAATLIADFSFAE